MVRTTTRREIRGAAESKGANMTAYDCRLTGGFYSFRLYDHDGREQFTLSDACEAAELVYGSEWAEVFNGDEGTDRDSWQQEQKGN